MHIGVCSRLIAEIGSSELIWSLRMIDSTKDVTSYTTTDLASRIRDRELSPVEVTRAYLERIERIDPQLGSFFTVTAELALVAAAEAERDVLDGKPLGPLH